MPCTKANFKCIKDREMRPETIRYVKANIELYDIDSKGVLKDDRPLTKLKQDKRDCIKLRHLHLKEMVTKIQKQFTDSKNIFYPPIIFVTIKNT